MLPPERPDRIQIAFYDHRLVANAGLLLPVTLAQRLGLCQLVERHVDLGLAPGHANAGDKMMTLVASMLAGGDCIDDADALPAGRTSRVLGCVVKAPSTLGTFLRSSRWGHVRQLDRVSRELLAQAWAAGGGPGDGPLTIDLDSTICETYGFGKEGARRHNYTGQRGYHPLLAIAAGTGDVLLPVAFIAAPRRRRMVATVSPGDSVTRPAWSGPRRSTYSRYSLMTCDRFPVSDLAIASWREMTSKSGIVSFPSHGIEANYTGPYRVGQRLWRSVTRHQRVNRRLV